MALEMLKGNSTHPGPMPKSYSGTIQFVQGDFIGSTWADADIVFGGLLPNEETMRQLSDKFRQLKSGTRVLMLQDIHKEFTDGLRKVSERKYKLGWATDHPIFEYTRDTFAKVQEAPELNFEEPSVSDEEMRAPREKQEAADQDLKDKERKLQEMQKRATAIQ